MDQAQATHKILEEIKDSYLYIPVDVIDMFELYLNMAYAVGFNKGNSNLAHARPVLQLDKYGNTIKEFDSLADAGRALRIPIPNLHKICSGKGRLRTAGGFKWRYKTI